MKIKKDHDSGLPVCLSINLPIQAWKNGIHYEDSMCMSAMKNRMRKICLKFIETHKRIQIQNGLK